MADMELKKQHGFYSLEPLTEAGKAFVRRIGEATSWQITDWDRKEILLDSFFATAGDWCRRFVLPEGLSLKWGTSIYAGKQGEDALWEICA